MRASEEDGYKMLRLPRRWENLPGRVQNDDILARDQ
jgi:hypothetical protein